MMETATSSRPLALVTGASSGIGFELARQFAEHGYDLIVCGERDRIHKAAKDFERLGVGVKPVQADLSTYDGVEQLYAETARTARPLEAAAINAGVGIGGEFVGETSLEDELRMINLNVVSTVHLAKRVARDMVSRGSGRILITASVAGEMPSPLEAVYGATKAFDLSFAASLRHELKDTGVSVTALIPGPTDTEFFARANMADTRAADESHDNDPTDVAKQGFEALMAGKDRVYAASKLSTKLQGAAARFMPESIKAEMHQKLAKPKNSDKS